MTRDELIERLQGFEWNDVEFKLAQRDVPKSAYETVSAFSNTGGGWLVFGVREGADGFSVVGVVEVDKVQSDFLNTLRSGQKLSCIIHASPSVVECEGNKLLVFFIPEARRHDKPVHFAKELERSYIRRGACDQKCTEEELRRFIRDAAKSPYDSDVVELDPKQCFDEETIKWYRSEFNGTNHTANPSHTDLEFLHECGLVVEHGGALKPTRAAILLFGSTAACRQLLPRPVVDFQWNGSPKENVTPEVRWGDRLVADFNLFRTWMAIAERYAAHATHTFKLDPATMRRQDMPVDYLAFREATINLLIHQDYADYNRKGEIRLYSDRVEFVNPGDAFVSTEQLLEPGAKELRNPRIVTAFRRIGLSEEAGTGLRSIFHTWQGLGNVPPEIRNDKAEKVFGVTLLKERLISQEQLLFQARLGAHLSDNQAKVLAYVCRRGRIGLLDCRMVTGLPSAEAQQVLTSLVTQVLLAATGTGPGTTYALADHLAGTLAESPAVQPAGSEPSPASDQPARDTARLVTDQPPRAPGTAPAPVRAASGPSLQSLTPIQWQIVGICEAPRTAAAIMDHLGLTHRSYFRRTHLEPLLRGGVLQMTHPDVPNHKDQAYFLSPAGLKLKELRAQGQGPQP